MDELKDEFRMVMLGIDHINKGVEAHNYPEPISDRAHELSPETMKRLQRVADKFVSQLNKRAALARQEKNEHGHEFDFADAKYELPSYDDAKYKHVST